MTDRELKRHYRKMIRFYRRRVNEYTKRADEHKYIDLKNEEVALINARSAERNALYYTMLLEELG